MKNTYLKLTGAVIVIGLAFVSYSISVLAQNISNIICLDRHLLAPPSDDKSLINMKNSLEQRLVFLLNKVSPLYADYQETITKLVKKIEANIPLEKNEIEAYKDQKNRLGVFLQDWSDSFKKEWQESGEKGSDLIDKRGNRLYFKWMRSKYVELIEKALEMHVSITPLLRVGKIQLGDNYTHDNNYDVFLAKKKKGALGKPVVFLMHMRTDIGAEKLMTLHPLEGELYIYGASFSSKFTGEGFDERLLEMYGESKLKMMIIKPNGLLVIPEIDQKISDFEKPGTDSAASSL